MRASSRYLHTVRDEILKFNRDQITVKSYVGGLRPQFQDPSERSIRFRCDLTPVLQSSSPIPDRRGTTVMAKQKPCLSSARKIPKVRIVRYSDRPFQLRYDCPVEKRQIRISTGTRDDDEAERQKAELEAKLLLGISIAKERVKVLGLEMEWSDFREQYRTLHLATVRDSTGIHAESRVDLAERILRPKTLGDMADSNSLLQLQAKLLAGEQSRRKKTRSPHTVKGYIGCVMAALNWAHMQDWLPTAPKIRKLKTSKMKSMTGRPIATSTSAASVQNREELTGDGGGTALGGVKGDGNGVGDGTFEC